MRLLVLGTHGSHRWLTRCHLNNTRIAYAATTILVVLRLVGQIILWHRASRCLPWIGSIELTSSRNHLAAALLHQSTVLKLRRRAPGRRPSPIVPLTYKTTPQWKDVSLYQNTKSTKPSHLHSCEQSTSTHTSSFRSSFQLLQIFRATCWL